MIPPKNPCPCISKSYYHIITKVETDDRDNNKMSYQTVCIQQDRYFMYLFLILGLSQNLLMGQKIFLQLGFITKHGVICQKTNLV